MINKLSIVIPIYNEDKTVHLILDKLRNIKLSQSIAKEIIRCKDSYTYIQDADLEYDPNEYKILLQPVLDGFAAVVYGSRFIRGNAPTACCFFGIQSEINFSQRYAIGSPI